MTDYTDDLESVVKEMRLDLRLILIDGRIPGYQRQRIIEVLTRVQLLLTTHKLTTKGGQA